MSERSPLSERELEILALLATGASNRQIAQELTISTNTVKVHLRNIYEKIGVASRTEATVFALREGLVEIEGVSIEEDEPSIPSQSLTKSRLSTLYWILPLLVVLSLGTLFLLYPRQSSPTSEGRVEPPPSTSRWQMRTSLPTARAAQAVTTYNTHIYVIGGETRDGVSAAVDRYDPQEDQWESVHSKPLAVSDIQAAVLGGKIYVPGGRLASGEPTEVVEVYDPEGGVWGQVAPLPQPRSAYSLVSYEGRLYLFGGWDGVEFSDQVFFYDPQEDVWSAGTPMDTARGYTGAVVAGGAIYLLGGTDGEEVFDLNWQYSPSREGSLHSPWDQAMPMPDARYAMGVATVGDIVYLVGGEGDGEESYQYFPASDTWKSFEARAGGTWSYIGLVGQDVHLFSIGGRENGEWQAQVESYQAIFTIVIPVVE